MGYVKYQRKIDGRFGRKIMRCSDWGVVIELGEFFYSRVTKRRTKNSVKHLCEFCYEKQYINA